MRVSVHVIEMAVINSLPPHRTSASLLWCEFTSFIKGSCRSVDNDSGHLTLEQYQAVGIKRAPNFKCSRKAIYEIFLEYERIKVSHWQLLAHKC